MKICSIEGCGRPHQARGWCDSHLWRWRKYGDVSRGGTLIRTKGEAAKYYEDVVLNFKGEGCLIWPFNRNEHGYGLIHVRGKMRRVHRLACEEINGPPPSSKHVAAHNCGKGSSGCCNPHHTRWATDAENKADMVIHGTALRGERQGGSKLTEAEVREIRALRGIMLQSEIAKRFNTSQMQVSRIQLRVRWGWLDDDASLRASVGRR